MLFVVQAVDDLRSVETAFSDLHRRYEKTKQAVDAYKKVGRTNSYQPKQLDHCRRVDGVRVRTTSLERRRSRGRTDGGNSREREVQRREGQRREGQKRSREGKGRVGCSRGTEGQKRSREWMGR